MAVVRRLPKASLKLRAPGVYGRIPFVSIHVSRRSAGVPRQAACL